MANTDSQVFFSQDNFFIKSDNRGLVGGLFLILWYRSHSFKLSQSNILCYHYYFYVLAEILFCLNIFSY